MSLHRYDKKKVCDIVVGDVIVHQSDELRPVEFADLVIKNRMVVGIKLSGSLPDLDGGWKTTYHDPDYEERVLVKNESVDGK